MDAVEHQRRRLRWRCRRGMRELDQMLGDFLEGGYANLSADLQHAFDRLLDLEDDVLWAALSAQRTLADPMLAEVVSAVRAPAR